MAQIIVSSAHAQWVERVPRSSVRRTVTALRRQGFRIVSVIG